MGLETGKFLKRPPYMTSVYLRVLVLKRYARDSSLTIIWQPFASSRQPGSQIPKRPAFRNWTKKMRISLWPTFAALRNVCGASLNTLGGGMLLRYSHKHL